MEPLIRFSQSCALPGLSARRPTVDVLATFAKSVADGYARLKL
jgi:hypothetical protein